MMNSQALPTIHSMPHRARGTSLNRGSLLANRDLYRDRESGEAEDVTQVVEYMVRPAEIRGDF